MGIKLTVLGSSSKGNCYLYEKNGQILIIEAGISILDIKKGLHFSFKNVVGCLVTHSHKDHSKSINELLRLGVRVYGLSAVFTPDQLMSPFCYPFEVLDNNKGRDLYIQSFKVKAFLGYHDVPVSVFLIDNETVFATDTFAMPVQFKNIRNYIIEANYDMDKLLQLDNKDFLISRVIKSHLSIKNCIDYLDKDLESIENIILIHLSDNNSIAHEFKEKIQRVTGKPTYIADAGLEVNL